MSTLSRAIVGWCGVLLAAAGYLELDAARPRGANPVLPGARMASSQTPSSNAVRPAGPERALFDKYCVTCHNERRKTAGLMLDMLDSDRVGDRADAWEKVVQKLRTHEMPPPGLPRPDRASYRAVAESLENALDGAAAARPDPGRVPIHRLNRAEFTNAVRDL